MAKRGRIAGGRHAVVEDAYERYVAANAQLEERIQCLEDCLERRIVNMLERFDAIAITNRPHNRQLNQHLAKDEVLEDAVTYNSIQGRQPSVQESWALEKAIAEPIDKWPITSKKILLNPIVDWNKSSIFYEDPIESAEAMEIEFTKDEKFALVDVIANCWQDQH